MDRTHLLFSEKGLEEYAFLLNQHKSPLRMTLHGDTYVFPTAEHAYQACKIPVEHKDMIQAVLNMSIKEVKNEGYHLPCISGWDDKRLYWATKILWAKFNQHPLLANKLLSFYTGENNMGCPIKIYHAVNFEATSDTPLWGVDSQMHGHNLQGRLLMGIAHHHLLQACQHKKIKILNKNHSHQLQTEYLFIGKNSLFENNYSTTGANIVKEKKRESHIKQFCQDLAMSDTLQSGLLALHKQMQEKNELNMLCFCHPRNCHGDIWAILYYLYYYLNFSQKMLENWLKWFAINGYNWENLNKIDELSSNNVDTTYSYFGQGIIDIF